MNTQGIKSPFIVFYPHIVRKGGVTSSLASAVDIAPTLLEIADAKRSPGLQGISLLPILNNPDTEVREFALQSIIGMLSKLMNGPSLRRNLYI